MGIKTAIIYTLVLPSSATVENAADADVILSRLSTSWEDGVGCVCDLVNSEGSWLSEADVDTTAETGMKGTDHCNKVRIGLDHEGLPSRVYTIQWGNKIFNRGCSQLMHAKH